ncbi:hypothetical protein VQ03_29285 [Methylobacterium tarhaniae]|uniref:Uncharacterized protein n=1 Tax=Methylobacterium tarhaniae TaxID=1187852 RepID=A0A0J6UTM9_9HYPH|nr:hypothetical protein [Methylobacterium tarhaniae]KMO29516.1 hypothetical protein VQ03_29285 [Methylobacterium tarhaniae]
MGKLHHIWVRRAHGLPMPLPPKPKRPLGPPVILYWGDAPIRMRSDIEKANLTWEGFLDIMAGEEAEATMRSELPMGARGADAVRKLTLEHERPVVMRDYWARVRVAMERESEHERRRWEALVGIESARLARIAGPPSFLSRFFGRAA